MKSRVLALVTALLLLGGCTGDTLTGVEDEAPAPTMTEDGTSKKGIKMVPYKGTATGGALEQAPHPDCPGATVIRSVHAGTGHSTHLGNSTWTGWHCFNYVTLAFYDGHVTFVAANGDELHIEYSGALTGPNTWAERDVIVGGTGRFENATGWADVTGESIDTPEGPVWNITYDGMMSSVGSSR